MINSTSPRISVCLEDLAPAAQLVAWLMAVERPGWEVLFSVALCPSSHQTHLSQNFHFGFP
jgi:hypothetical protein